MSNTAAIASSRDAASIGATASGQLDLLWRAMMAGQGGESGDGWFRIASGQPHPLGNVAILLDGDDRDTATAAAAPLLALDVPSAVMFPHGVGTKTANALAALGFHAHGAMPAMAVDIGRLPTTALPAGHAWERIDAGDVAREWTDAVAGGYDLPRGLARMLSPEVLGADMAGDAHAQFFGIRHAGRLVCTSMLYLADGVAGIYCVATLPSARGRGLGAHATAEPLRIAHRLGYRVGVLQSSESGHGVYRRLGFEDVAEIPLFIRVP